MISGEYVYTSLKRICESCAKPYITHLFASGVVNLELRPAWLVTFGKNFDIRPPLEIRQDYFVNQYRCY